jgi:hypothetical protein
MASTRRAPLLLALFVCVALLFVSRAARAECDGPAECCITDPAAATVPLPERVRVGLRVLRIGAVSERDGEYHADLYILTRWPAGGVAPALVARNVVDSTNAVEDRIQRGKDDFCYHAVRIQDDFETPFVLHRFPFDKQRLRLLLEDFKYRPDVYTYDAELWPMTISNETYRDLNAWRVERYPTFTQRDSTGRFFPGDQPARLLLVEIPVQRVWEFYMSRYFFPLLLIVALSYSLFYVQPDDLASSSGIGITAVLAIIAFQLAQAESMPHVAYMTLADKVYVICYLFTSVALALTIHGTYISRHGGAERADALQRRYRIAFPLLFVLSFAAAAAWGWEAGAGETATPQTALPPATPPSGEVVY